MKRLAFILILVCAIVSCNPNNEEITHMNSSDISLTWKGTAQVVYNHDTFQIGYNSSKCEYRVYEDKLASWFTLRCSGKPTTEGQILSADVSWTGQRSTKVFKALRFEVQKLDDNGLIWLWNNSEKIGIIIKDIQ